MKIQHATLWITLASIFSTYAAAQSEPFYIPNTPPPNTPAQGGAPYAYTPPPEMNTGRPASSEAPQQNSDVLSDAPIYTYTQIGTEGVGLGYGMKVSPSWAVRAEINALNYNKDVSKGNNSYAGKIKLRSEGMYADYYPMEGSAVRVTGGLMFNQSSTTATTSTANINLNGTSYALANPASAKIKLSNFMPYLGVGYGHDEAEKAGFKLHADAGIAMGKKPEVALSATPASSVADPAAFERARKAEEDKIADSAKKLRVLPVLKIGAGYTW